MLFVLHVYEPIYGKRQQSSSLLYHPLDHLCTYTELHIISHGKSCSLQHLRSILICLTAIQFSCPFLQSSQFFFCTCTFSLSFNQGGLLFFNCLQQISPQFLRG